MNAQTRETLFETITHKPSILLLGQSYLGPAKQGNPFLKAVCEHFHLVPNGEDALLDQLLGKLEQIDQSGSIRWLHRRSETVPISESLDLVSEFAWSNVYTSAIDEVWVRAFKKSWRSLNAVFAENAWPLETRDRNLLCSTFLFGCVDKEDEDSRIPTNSFQFEERSQQAISLIRRLPEITTPLGVVVIEGYDPANDWLKPKDLYPVLNALAPGQSVLFSTTSVSRSDKYLAKLHDAGKLIFFEEPLAAFLKRGVDDKLIVLGDPAVKLPAGRQITIDGKPHIIPKDLWMKLAGIATVLDDNTLVPPRHSSLDQEYVAYRNFLADPIKLNDWSGFAKGFVFARDFERNLRGECEKRLRNKRLQLDPILLHGESGTGKTIAMAHLAYSIGSESEFPTLFIEKSTSLPDWRPIDRFLNWAEDCGAASCLILWDGMREEDQYENLLRKLADRGRKAVLVGSTYYASEKVPKLSYIEAPRELNGFEKKAFKEYLTRFDSNFAERMSASEIAVDSTFLVALYRLLPTTRPRLAKGVTSEVEHAGKDIFEKIKTAVAQKTSLNSLELAFQESGLLLASDKILTDAVRHDIDSDQMTEIRDLFALVMVPGKYGFPVPIELLLSALKKSVNSSMITALQTNVLLWSEKPNGEILVAPRHPLEAKLYLDSLYRGAPEAESEFICKLLQGLKRGASGEAHIDFIVDLLKHVGPNSPVERNKAHFSRCTLDFARALTALRAEKSVISPRLMLQEGSFYREAIKSRESEWPLEETLKILETAENVLLQAREREDCPVALKSSINTELANCYGSMIHTLEEAKSDQLDIVTLYDRAKEALKEAVRRDWANAHVVVTLGTISRRMLDSSSITSQERCEIEAELMFRFDEAMPSSMDAVQQGYFYTERMKVMDKLGHLEMAEQTFELLRLSGSKAGYFLRARSYFKDFPEQGVTEEDLDSLSRSEQYLVDNWDEIFSDERCLGLYLKVWWYTNAHSQMFGKERQILPFSDLQWNKLHQVVAQLKTLKQPECPSWVYFLHALCLFHTGNIGPSLTEFRTLSSDPNLHLGGNRLKKYFIASHGGQPRTFDGVVRSRIEENKIGEIWVNDLHYSIPIIPRDFDSRELRQGQTVPDFHIAFAYTGPIAQPAHFLRGRT